MFVVLLSLLSVAAADFRMYTQYCRLFLSISADMRQGYSVLLGKVLVALQAVIPSSNWSAWVGSTRSSRISSPLTSQARRSPILGLIPGAKHDKFVADERNYFCSPELFVLATVILQGWRVM